ncbi:unnamed protein product [Paramecium sonneborni]|uniref:Rab-family small GTPase n=1 Tax=Paramecium sonneborni TaxID=65129 RepID=A0A8S1RNQ3_9CILI|nr:unnamed protein product [Paramecium sonneborni]
MFHYCLRLILIGDDFVGKSCIISQFLDQKMCGFHTLGIDFNVKMLEIDDKMIKLQILDTNGLKSFQQITRPYYRSAAGAILVYDITDRESFQNVQYWIKECQEYGRQDITILLVGNKVDLEKQRQVSLSDGQQFANENNLLFIETSAKNNLNIIETFQVAARQALRVVEKSQQKHELPGVRIGQPFKQTQIQNSSKSGGCF